MAAGGTSTSGLTSLAAFGSAAVFTPALSSSLTLNVSVTTVVVVMVDFDPEHLERVAIGERLMVAAAGGVVELVVVVIADVENIEAGSAGDLHRLKIRHVIQNVPNLGSVLEYRCRRNRRPVHGECQRDEAAVVRRRNEDDGGIDLVGFGDVDREARGRDVVSGAVIPVARYAIDELHRQYFRTRKLFPGLLVAIDPLAIADADLGARGIH